MTDIFTASKRSEIMKSVKSSDTKPEMFVRKLLFNSGFRYRLRCSDLPGTPDIVLKKWKVIIFVNGCFWHHHEGCHKATFPKSRESFWHKKLKRNMERDTEIAEILKVDGWRILSVWECACMARCKEDLQLMLEDFIRGNAKEGAIGRDWERDGFSIRFEIKM